MKKSPIKFVVSTIVVVLFSFLISTNLAAQNEDSVPGEPRTFKATDGATMPYRVFIPDGLEKDKTYPLIQTEIKDAHQILEDQNMFLELQKSLEKLKTKYQEVIALKFFDELKIKEISEILKKSEGTIKSLIHSGLKQLKTHIKHSIFFKEGE